MYGYSTYKESGVAWVGRIPTHWDVWKVSHAFPKTGSGTTPKSDNPAYFVNGEIPWINTGDLNDGQVFEAKRKVTTKALGDYSTLKVFPTGSLIIAMYGATIGKVGITQFEAVTNQACCVLPKSEVIDIDFAFFWLLAQRQHIISMAYGGGQPNISQELIRSLRIPAPPLPEQTTIARFLTHKTQQIDEAVRQYERLIELLREERAALINEAVTRGLDPDAPTKPSGVDWLGEVPKHWEVVKLKYTWTKLVSGGTPSTDKKEFWNGKIPWVSPKDMKKQEINGTQDHVTDEAILSGGTKLVPKGSILLVVRSGILKHTLPVAIASRDLTINQDLKGIIPIDDIFSRYFMYLHIGLENELLTYCTKIGSTVDSLEMEYYANFPVGIPPKVDQANIVTFIEKEFSRIDAEVLNIKQEITLLQEYRQALITETVTGKIDVRGWEAEA